MNKIGLLTFHRTTNFGSSLQAYALFYKIKDLGYDCDVIDYRCPAIEVRENICNKLDLKNPKDIVRHLLYGRTITKKAKILEDFNVKKMALSIPYTPETIMRANSEYSKFIVGSDIVWGRDITNDDYNYFLEFVYDDSKKYAFSSSVGDCVVREDENRLTRLLQNFQRIAVREDEGVEWVKSISGMQADLVCDPTMLLTCDEWESAIKPANYSGKYVLVYFDNDNHKCLRDAQSYANLHGKQVYLINYGRPKKNVHNIKPTSLEEFLGLIKNADMVFTASYHGMLFSIYFQREFLFYTRAHKSRVLSLARRLKVLDHCGDDVLVEQYIPIRYECVNEAVREFRKESIDILNGMLIQ